jgi:hypothetical protein
MEQLVVKDGWRYHMRTAMVLMLLSLSNAVLLFGQDARAEPEVRIAQTAPLIELRVSTEIKNRGERMQVRFTTSQNVFVAILRFDTDGRVRMLYPEKPWHNSYVEAGRVHEVRNPVCGQAGCAFVIDDYPGQGYIFAIASMSPLDLEKFANGDYWSYSTIAHRGRVTGDPFVAISGLMRRVIPESTDGEASFDVQPYHVGRQFEYPRFLCYECHTFVRYPAWDPYQQSCTRFQVVRYDEPAYEPFSAYGDARIVLERPRALEPRFVFEDRDINDPFLAVRQERTTNSPTRRSGATALDFGGIGSIPAPLGRRGTASGSSLRWLSPLERAIRDGRVGSVNDTSAARRQPQLRRRTATKPDTSRKTR